MLIFWEMFQTSGEDISDISFREMNHSGDVVHNIITGNNSDLVHFSRFKHFAPDHAKCCCLHLNNLNVQISLKNDCYTGINRQLLLQFRSGSLQFPAVQVILSDPWSTTYPLAHTRVTSEPSGKSFFRMASSLNTTLPSRTGFGHSTGQGRNTNMLLLHLQGLPFTILDFPFSKEVDPYSHTWTQHSTKSEHCEFFFSVRKMPRG